MAVKSSPAFGDDGMLETCIVIVFGAFSPLFSDPRPSAKSLILSFQTINALLYSSPKGLLHFLREAVLDRRYSVLTAGKGTKDLE